MFRHKNIEAALERLSTRISDNDTYTRDKYYEPRADIDRLVEALGMTKDHRTINEYVKKGGPERGD